ncbi:MAG: hypothetical protein IT453_14520 [Planctomycetes bacterium]|nr:hypothetical protein [Planctomycetota bacterium]
MTEGDSRLDRPLETSTLQRSLLVGWVALACLASGAVAANAWTGRDWLEKKWAARMPWGLVALTLCAAASCVAGLALVRAWRSGAWRNAGFAPWRWLVVLGCAAWACMWTLEPPTHAYDAQLAFCVAAALWSLAVAVHVRRPPRPTMRWLRTLDWLAFQLAACVVAIESTLRVVRAEVPLSILATSGNSVDAWLDFHRRPPGTRHFGFQVNSQGYVDVEPAEAKRREHLVACIGDSFSVGIVPHHVHYTTVAEREFESLEVYNVGVVSSGPREYVHMLEHDVLPLAPELIVIALFLGNDVDDSTRGLTTARGRWLDRDEILVLQVPKRLWRLREEREGTGVVHAAERPTAKVPTIELIEQRMPWLRDPLREKPTFTSERFDAIERQRARICSPDQRALHEHVLARLENLRRVAGDVPLAVLLIPDEFQVEDALWERASREYPGADREQPQRIVGEWLEAHGVPYVDLLPRLRAVEPLPDGSRHVYHLRDTHFNVRGNALAAKALAELIERCGVAKRAQ